MAEEQRPGDPVSEVFENLRAAARKRGTPLPDLSRQGRRPLPRGNSGDRGTSRSGAGKPSLRGAGRPSGPDGRRPRRPLEVSSLGSLVDGEISRRGWEKGLAGGWVHSHWAELVGPKIAQHTRVDMIKEKTLFITCDSTAWATNLRMMQRQILRSIAEKVGPNIISELRIHGPKPPSWRKGPLHVKGRGPRDTYG